MNRSERSEDGGGAPSSDNRVMSSLSGRARRYLLDAARAFERAPVEVAVFVFLGATFSWAIAEAGPAVRTWFEIATAAVIVLVGAWTGTLLHAAGRWSKARRWAATLGGAALALLYAYTLADFERIAEVWRAVMLVAAGALWLLAVPLFAPIGGTATDRVRIVDGRVLLRALGALLYTAALYGGLALALAAVDNLFELDLEWKLYVHVLGWLVFVLAPWIIIGGIDDYVRDFRGGSAVAGVVHRMAAFLVPPLLALYCIILYAYAIRIGVAGEIPKNLVSPMVLAAGVLAALALFLFEPRPDEPGGQRVLRFAPPLFVPLAVLGTLAILLRYEQYGWTEFRLIRLIVLVVLGLLAIAATVQLVRRRRFALHVVPLVLAIVLVLAAIGPWSIMATSRRDQLTRLDATLQELTAAGPLPARPPRAVSAARYDAVHNGAVWLVRHYGVHSLPEPLRAYVTDSSDAWELPERLGLRREIGEGAPMPGRYVHVRGTTSDGVRVTDRLIVYRVYANTDSGTAVNPDVSSRRPAMPPGQGGGRVVAHVAGRVLTLRVGNDVLTADLTDVLGAVGEVPPDRGAELPPARSTAVALDADGRARGHVVILELTGHYTGTDLAITHIDVLLLLEP